MGSSICSKGETGKKCHALLGMALARRSDLAKPQWRLQKAGQRQQTFQDKTQPVRGWRVIQLTLPVGCRWRRGEGEGRAGTASLLALAHDLSSSPSLTPWRHPRSPMTVSASCSLSKAGGGGAFQTLHHSWLTQKSRDRRPSRVCSKLKQYIF